MDPSLTVKQHFNTLLVSRDSCQNSLTSDLKVESYIYIHFQVNFVMKLASLTYGPL